ncbi:hypothetical protein HNP55_003041 [Paucibacter oligotrophus]|uniref:Uncharacterized protein n=1 Tax=Roseateles oligotrophus TaxID=1769250 RepID=A0A840LGU0_9BURK|nr:hypothetical protein [Roseateles oligotrophus]MBB4844497.1 hypothetical protein [Roseateles oligotrophus]
MASFTELDWSRLDTFAIIFGRGLASVEHKSLAGAASWLEKNAYQRIHLSFHEGISPVVAELGRLLAWEQEFGYSLQGSSRNLAALHDGFHFEIQPTGGLVLDLVAFDKAIQEDKAWSTGFLAIASEHSLRQLAVGRRFFCLVHVSDDHSPIIGQTYEELAVPYPFPFRAPAA